MRTWQVERRKRTRHLIELGGLVVKAGIVELTGDDRATIFGALLWVADKLKSDQGERGRALSAAKGSKRLSRSPARRIERDQIASAVRRCCMMIDVRENNCVSEALDGAMSVRSADYGNSRSAKFRVHLRVHLLRAIDDSRRQ